MKNSISGYTRLAGVIAQPIKHSLSPKIHNSAYEMLNYDAVYLAFEVEEEEFLKTIESVKTLDMIGVNVSMPYKKLAYEACDELSEEAKLIGVVNTIVQRDGKLTGFNTDGIGFIANLKDQGVPIEGKVLTMLGAGGAAQAIICQSASDGIAKINVFKRKNASYQQTEAELKAIEKQTGTTIQLFDYNDDELMNEIITKSDIIVNGTKLGMGEDKQLPIPDISVIGGQHVVVDLIYHPLETEFLKRAKKNNALTINGLGMLLYQAAFAFQLMTGQEMPTKKIAAILEEEWQ